MASRVALSLSLSIILILAGAFWAPGRPAVHRGGLRAGAMPAQGSARKSPPRAPQGSPAALKKLAEAKSPSAATPPAKKGKGEEGTAKPLLPPVPEQAAPDPTNGPDAPAAPHTSKPERAAVEASGEEEDSDMGSKVDAKVLGAVPGTPPPPPGSLPPFAQHTAAPKEEDKELLTNKDLRQGLNTSKGENWLALKISQRMQQALTAVLIELDAPAFTLNETTEAELLKHYAALDTNIQDTRAALEAKQKTEVDAFHSTLMENSDEETSDLRNLSKMPRFAVAAQAAEIVLHILNMLGHLLYSDQLKALAVQAKEFLANFKTGILSGTQLTDLNLKTVKTTAENNVMMFITAKDLVGLTKEKAGELLVRSYSMIESWTALEAKVNLMKQELEAKRELPVYSVEDPLLVNKRLRPAEEQEKIKELEKVAATEDGGGGRRRKKKNVPEEQQTAPEQGPAPAAYYFLKQHWPRTIYLFFTAHGLGSRATLLSTLDDAVLRHFGVKVTEWSPSRQEITAQLERANYWRGRRRGSAKKRKKVRLAEEKKAAAEKKDAEKKDLGASEKEKEKEKKKEKASSPNKAAGDDDDDDEAEEEDEPTTPKPSKKERKAAKKKAEKETAAAKKNAESSGERLAAKEAAEQVLGKHDKKLARLEQLLASSPDKAKRKRGEITPQQKEAAELLASLRKDREKLLKNLG